MLSDRERRELALIEQRLGEDRRLVASLGAGPYRRRWPIRLLTVLGVLLIVIGIVTSTGGLLLQGVLAAAAGFAWSRWRISHAEAARHAPT